MKLKVIIGVFTRRNKMENPLIVKMLDTINDFDRKMDLKPPFRELKQIYEDYEEERAKYAKKLIQTFCDEENERHKNNENWEDLNPKNITQVPDHMMDDYNKEIKSRQEKEIELKEKLFFYKDEVMRARLTFSEEELLDEFVDWKKNKPTKRKKK